MEGGSIATVTMGLCRSVQEPDNYMKEATPEPGSVRLQLSA